MITKPLHVLRFSFSASNIFLFFLLHFQMFLSDSLFLFQMFLFLLLQFQMLLFSPFPVPYAAVFFFFSSSCFSFRLPNWSLCPFLFVRLVPERFFCFGLAYPVFFF